MRATSAQQGLWFAHRVAPNPDVFTIGQLVDFDAQPEPGRLSAAVRQAVAEADGLHSIFSEQGGVFSEQDGDVTVELGAPIEVADRDLGDDADAIDEYAQAAVQLAIDPASGPCAVVEILHAGGRTALLLVAHHIVIDAYGLGLLVRRIGRLYADPDDRRRLGSVVDLPPEPDAGASAEFWSRELTGISGPLTLGDAPRSHRIAAAVHTTRAVVGGAGGAAMSPDRLVAAVAAFCARVTGSDDVLIGFPMMNRFGSPTANVVCTTVNVVPLRVAVAPAVTADELAADAAAGIRRIAPHARYRGEDILRDARRRAVDGVVGPTVNVKPFGSTVTFDSGTQGSAEADSADSITATVRSLRRGPVVDLSITALDLGSTESDRSDLELTLDADAAIYSRAHAARIAESLAAFVGEFLREPTRPVGAMRIVDHVSDVREADVPEPGAPATDRARVDVLRSGTTAPIDPTPLDARIATAEPDAIAVRFGDDAIDFRELNRRADELVARLGPVAPDSVIAIALPRGIDLIVALVAVMRSGAAFLPLDPGFPADRREASIADAAPVAVIEPAITELAVVASGNRDVQIRRLSDPRQLPVTTMSDDPVGNSDDPTGDAAAYLIYTSGSTGTPKGVVIPNRALRNFTDHMVSGLGLGPSRSLLAVTTISFDIALLETLVPLSAGACVVLADNDDIHDPARLAALISRHRPDVVQATPSLWSAFLGAGWGSALADVDVLVGGEQLPSDVARGLVASARSVRNMYGPTETTIWSTTAEVDDDTDVTIGTPIANTVVRVLDSTLHPVPVGRVGELYLSGDGLARGYRGLPGMTAARFVADPFTDGARMYRTGDLARIRPDGRLDCLGRTDHQVKVRGFRVELGDIETALSALPAVAGAVVTSVDGRLVGYVTTHSDSSSADNTDSADNTALAQSWRSEIAKVLPDYMVPSALIVLDEFPLTPNGKIDRRALPAPDYAAQAARSRPPSGPVETALADVFASVLGLPAVGAEDNFFTLGGDSIVAVRVVSAAASAGWEVTPLEIFDHPTVEGLAAVARSLTNAERGHQRLSTDPQFPTDQQFSADRAGATTAGIDDDELNELMEGDLL